LAPYVTGARQFHGEGRHAMNSTVIKRSIVVAGHKTSVSLEDEFWNALKEIAGLPDDQDKQTDVWDVSVPVCVGLMSNLQKSDHRQQRDQEPQ
jgi:hypothetical protein